MKKAFYLICLLLSFKSYAQYCTSDNRFTELEYFSGAQIKIDTGVVYSTNVKNWLDNYQDLALDFYYPDTTIDQLKERPFILMIHGGGFKSGSKSGLKRHCEGFAKRGFVTASLQYRLGWDESNKLNQVPAVYRAQQDAHAAMRFIVEHATDYNIDTSWMFIGGQSAGALTSLGLNYINQNEWNAIYPNYENTYGSLDTVGNKLVNSFSFKGIFNNWGNVLGASIQEEEMKPTISFHGVLDNTIPIRISPQGSYGSGTLHDTLVSKGICSEITIDSTGGHGIYKEGLGIDFRIKRACCFFKSVFCENCNSEFFTDSISPSCSSVLALDEFDYMSSLIKVSPNPTSDFITMNMKHGNYEFVVFDLKGKNLLSSTIEGEHIAIDLSTLSEGLYILQVSDLEQGIIKQIRLVKE